MSIQSPSNEKIGIQMEKLLQHNYDTSKDYEKLWELMKTQRILCMIDYGEMYKDDKYQLRDVCQTPAVERDRYFTDISCRGYSYISARNKEEFIEQCTKGNLEYIVPTKKD